MNVYLCPKCGAVANLKWMRAYTEADMVAEEERAPRWNMFGGCASQSATIAYMDRLEAVREGINHGEHLACSCPRCAHAWVEPVLAATASDIVNRVSVPVDDEGAQS